MTESIPIILPPRRPPSPSSGGPTGQGRFRAVLKRVAVVMLLLCVVLLAGRFVVRWWRAQQPPPFPYVELQPGGGNLNWLDERRLLFTGWGHGEDDTERSDHFTRLYVYDTTTKQVTFLRKVGVHARLCVTDDEVVFGPMESEVPPGASVHEYRWRGPLGAEKLEPLRYPLDDSRYRWNPYTCRMEEPPRVQTRTHRWWLLRAGDGAIHGGGSRFDDPSNNASLVSDKGVLRLGLPVGANAIRSFRYVPHEGRYFWVQPLGGLQIDRWRVSDCLEGWWLDARLPAVERACIPYTGLVSVLPILVVIPVRSGWVTASGGFGGPGRPDSGKVVFVPVSNDGSHGEPVPLFFGGMVSVPPVLSPDGCRVAVSIRIRYKPRKTVLRIVDFCSGSQGG